MTIDPTKPEMYRLRNGCEVVRIIPTPELEDSESRLLVIYRRMSGGTTSVFLTEEGRCLADGRETCLDLIPHDPVLYYGNVYQSGFGHEKATLPKAREDSMASEAIARIAVHASGKVRQIPLTATTDQENQA